MTRAVLTAMLLAGCAAQAADDDVTEGAGSGRTADSRRDLRELAAFRPAGEPRSCIPITRIRRSEVLSDRVIDFELTGGENGYNAQPLDAWWALLASATALAILGSYALARLVLSPWRATLLVAVIAFFFFVWYLAWTLSGLE